MGKNRLVWKEWEKKPNSLEGVGKKPNSLKGMEKNELVWEKNMN